MAIHRLSGLTQLRQAFAVLLSGQAALAFLPALTLLVFWIGGEMPLIAAAALPLFSLRGSALAGISAPKTRSAASYNAAL